MIKSKIKNQLKTLKIIVCYKNKHLNRIVIHLDHPLHQV